MVSGAESVTQCGDTVKVDADLPTSLKVGKHGGWAETASGTPKVHDIHAPSVQCPQSQKTLSRLRAGRWGKAKLRTAIEHSTVPITSQFEHCNLNIAVSAADRKCSLLSFSLLVLAKALAQAADRNSALSLLWNTYLEQNRGGCTAGSSWPRLTAQRQSLQGAHGGNC